MGEMGVPDHLTSLLKNLYMGEEATIRTGHGRMDWFKIGKGVHQGCLFNFAFLHFFLRDTFDYHQVK